MFCGKTSAHEITMPRRLRFENSVDKVTALPQLNLGTIIVIHC